MHLIPKQNSNINLRGIPLKSFIHFHWTRQTKLLTPFFSSSVWPLCLLTFLWSVSYRASLRARVWPKELELLATSNTEASWCFNQLRVRPSRPGKDNTMEIQLYCNYPSLTKQNWTLIEKIEMFWIDKQNALKCNLLFTKLNDLWITEMHLALPRSLQSPTSTLNPQLPANHLQLLSPPPPLTSTSPPIKDLYLFGSWAFFNVLKIKKT